jgi:putative membrane protein
MRRLCAKSITMPLSEKEQQQINTLVARFEADTGIQTVAAVIGKADAYPEIPWKAYALGSALGTLALALDPGVFPQWAQTHLAGFHAMVILGTGAVSSIAAAFMPPIGRLFLNHLRAQGEARQYAQALFLERELFRTADRCGVLVLVSQYERAVVILPDSGLAKACSAGQLERAVATMRPLLARGQTGAAFEAGFNSLKTQLVAAGSALNRSANNELADAVVVEPGP